jgi:hypothetical protein
MLTIVRTDGRGSRSSRPAPKHNVGAAPARRSSRTAVAIGSPGAPNAYARQVLDLSAHPLPARSPEKPSIRALDASY